MGSKERNEQVVKHAQRWGRNRPQEGDDEATKIDKEEAQRTSARVIRHINEVENRNYPQQGGRQR